MDFEGNDPNACPADIFARFCCDEHPGVEVGDLCDGAADEGPCPCRDCGGLLDVTGCSDFSFSGRSYALEIHEFSEAPGGALIAGNRRTLPIASEFYFGAKREGSLVRDDSVLATIPDGRLLMGKQTCSSFAGASHCGRLSLVDLRPGADFGNETWSLITVEEPRIALGLAGQSIGERVGFAATMSQSLYAGRLGGVDNVISRAPARLRDGPAPFIGHGVFPLAGGHLLTLLDSRGDDDTPEDVVLRLLSPSDLMLKDELALNHERPMIEAAGCDEVRDCRNTYPIETLVEDRDVLDLEALNAPEPLSQDWNYCPVLTIVRRGGELVREPGDCPTDRMIESWEESQTQRGRTYWRQRYAFSGDPRDFLVQFPQLSREGRGIFVTCDRGSVVTEDLPRIQPDGTGFVLRRLRCARWQEFYVPGRMVDGGRPRATTAFDLVRPMPRGPRCDLVGAPAREQYFRVEGAPLTVTVTDAEGGANPALAAGDSARVCAGQGQGEVSYRVITGQVVEPAESRTVLPAGQCLTVRADEPGTVIIEVRAIDAEGRQGAPVRVALVFDPASRCARDAEGRFIACAAPHPQRVPGPDEQPSAAQPAIAGHGVMLHDLSFQTDAPDLHLPAIGPPAYFGRSYSSARHPVRGGVLGGWHFWYDQRLLPIVPAGAERPSEHAAFEPDGAGFDLAFHDGTGRVDVYGFPGPEGIEQRAFGAGDEYWIHAVDGAGLEAKRGPEGQALTAEVVTFQRPRGRFEALRRYTLELPEGQVASGFHPYYEASAREVGPNEARWYELSDVDGVRRIFNCEGQLIRIIDPRFHEVELVYGGPVNALTGLRELTRVIDSNFREFVVEWGDTGGPDRYRRIRRIRDPEGREVRYDYTHLADGGARLAAVTLDFGGDADPSLNVTQITRYQYDDQGRLRALIQPGDARPWLTIEYDAVTGAVRRQIHGEEGPQQDDGPRVGGVWSFSNAGDAVEVTDPRGQARTYTLAPNAPGESRGLVSVTYEKEVWDGQLDPPGDALQVIDWSFLRDADGQVLESVEPSGQRTAQAFDARGLLIRREQHAAGGDGVQKVWEWTYDPECAMPIRERHPTGRVTTRTLHPMNDPAAPGVRCRFREEEAAPVTDGEGAVQRWTKRWDWQPSGPLRGVLREQTDFEGAQTHRRHRYEHDETHDGGEAGNFRRGKVPHARRGLVTRHTLDGVVPQSCEGQVPPSLVRELEHDARGNLLRERTWRDPAAGEAGGAYATERVHDRKDRVVRLINDPEGSAEITRYTYSPRDELVRLEVPRKDTFRQISGRAGSVFGDPTEVYDVTEHAYDLLGRRFATVEGAGSTGLDRHVTVVGHDGRGNEIVQLRSSSGIELDALANAAQVAPSAREILSGDFDDLGALARARGPQWSWVETRYDAEQHPRSVTVTDGLPTGAGVPEADRGVRYTERYWRDAAGDVVAWDMGRPGEALVVTRYNGHRQPASIETYSPGTGCETAGEWQPIRKVSYDGHDGDDQPAAMRVVGDDGGVRGGRDTFEPLPCAGGRELYVEEYAYDEWGRLQELRVPRFAEAHLLMDAYAGSEQVTRYSYDDGERAVRELDPNTGLVRTIDLYYTDLVCAQRTLIPENPGLPAIEQRVTRDGGGHSLVERVVGRAPGGEAEAVISERRFTRDSAGRVEAETDPLGQVSLFGYDAQGRVRGVVDQRGSLHETLYDALGNERYRVERNQDGLRGQIFTYTGLWLLDERVINAPAFINPLFFEPDHVHERHSFVYDAAGNLTREWPFGRGREVVVERRHDAQGNPVREILTNGVTVSREYSAMSNAVREVATAPWAERDTAPVGYRRAPLEQVRLFRFDGLGNLTGAQDRSGGDVVSLRRHYDSAGALLEERQTYHELPIASIVTTRARVDARGNTRLVAHDASPANQWDLEWSQDALDRTTRIQRVPGSQAFDDLHELRYGYAGAHLVSRTVDAGAHTLESRWRYNELAAPHQVDHRKDGVPFYRVRHFWRGQELFLKAHQSITPGGELRGDPALTNYELIGASHVNPNNGFYIDQVVSRIQQYNAYAGASLPSSFTGIRPNRFGQPIATLTTTYGAGGGEASLSYQFTRYSGGRRVGEQSANAEARTSTFREVRDAAFVYQTDADAALRCPGGRGPENRICRTQHLLLRDPDGLFQFDLPLQPGAETLGGRPVAAGDRHAYDWTYTPSTRQVRGLNGAVPEGHPERGNGDPPVQHYDLFDRLIETDDELTARQGRCNDALQRCAAGGRRIVWDALDRRVYEDYDATSSLLTERPRRLVYLGDWLTEEIHLRYGGFGFGPARGGLLSGGRTHHLRGPAGDLPYLRSAHVGGEMIPFEDLDNRFIGFLTLEDGEIEGRGSDLVSTNLKPQPFVGSDRNEDRLRVFRWTGPDTELHPFDGTEWNNGGGFFKDFKSNYIDDFWHAQEAFGAAIVEQRAVFDIIALVITFPAIAVAPFSLVAEGLMLAFDVGTAAHEAWTSGGISWMTGLTLAASIGGTYLGYLGHVADQAAAAQTAARRVRRSAQNAARARQAARAQEAAQPALASVATRPSRPLAPQKVYARMGANGRKVTDAQRTEAALEEGARIRVPSPDGTFKETYIVDAFESAAERRSAVQRLFDHVHDSELAVIGKDNVTDAAGKVIGANPEFVAFVESLESQGTKVTSIRNFQDAQVLPSHAAYSGYMSLWSPQSNLLWLEGIARARKPVVLAESVAEIFSRPQSFLAREFRVLAQRGCKLRRSASTADPRWGYGVLVPPARP